MLKLWLYITSLLKYIVFLLIIGGILTYFFSTIGLVISLVLFLGVFSAAKDDMNEKYAIALEKRRQKIIKKKAEESKYEFEGFEQALALTRREME